MKIFSNINLLRVLAVLVLVCHILVISMLLSSDVRSLSSIEQIQMGVYILSALFQYVVGCIMLILFGRTVESQQFFFIITLFCTSLLSSLLLLDNIFVISLDILTTILVRVHSFFYISMVLFLFLSAITLHYNFRGGNVWLFFVVISVSGVLARLGPAVISDSSNIAGAFVGGRNFLVSMVIALNIITLLVYLVDLSHVRSHRVVTQTQFIFLTGFIIFLHISLLLIGFPAIIILSSVLLMLSLGMYVRGYFSHAL